MKQDRIVILDLGSRDSTATARAIRALGVYSEIYPHDLTLAQLRALDNVRGVILNGGPNRGGTGETVNVGSELLTCGLPPGYRCPEPGHLAGGRRSDAGDTARVRVRCVRSRGQLEYGRFH